MNKDNENIKERIPMYHVTGCNGIAFYTTKRLIYGEGILSSETVIKIDGSKPMDCVEEMICGSCGKQITGLDVDYAPREKDS